MKRIISSFLWFVFVGAFFSVGGFVFAQTPTLVATVNIEGARIESQVGNEISLSFLLTNREQIQSGLRYGVQLIQATPKDQFVVYEHVFDEEVSLSQNVQLEKRVSFSAPAQLDGEYLLFITTRNESNFPFAAAFVDNVTFSPQQKGVSIDPATCLIKTSQDTFTLSQVAPLMPKEPFSVSCEAINYSGKMIEVALYGDVVAGSRYTEKENNVVSKSDTVLFQMGERKKVTLSLQAPEKPFKYEYKIGITALDLENGTVQFRSVVQGDSATINNLSFDKDKYSKGDVAQLLLLWESSFVDNSVKAKANPDVTLNLTVRNIFGVECAPPIVQQLSRFRTVSKIPIQITRDCVNPKVRVSLSDTAGNTLDEKEFSINTQNTLPMSKKTTTIVLVGIGILLAFALFQRFKKHALDKSDPSPNSPITGVLPFLIIFGVGMLMPISSVYADNYSYNTATGETITTTVNLDNTSYGPNAQILVTAYITNSGGNGNSFPVSLVANNNNDPSTTTTLIALTTLGTGSTPMVNMSPFSAPPSAGTFAVNFETSIEEPDAPTVSLVGFGAGQGWLDPLGTPAWEASAQVSEPAAGEGVDIQFDTYINGYYAGQEVLGVTMGQGPYVYREDYGVSQSNELPSYQTYSVQNVCIKAASSGIYVNPSYLCN